MCLCIWGANLLRPVDYLSGYGIRRSCARVAVAVVCRAKGHDGVVDEPRAPDPRGDGYHETLALPPPRQVEVVGAQQLEVLELDARALELGARRRKDLPRAGRPCRDQPL